MFVVVPSLSSSQRQKFKKSVCGFIDWNSQDKSRREARLGNGAGHLKPGLSKRISEGARICKGHSCGKFSKEKEGRSRGEGGEKRGKRYGGGR